MDKEIYLDNAASAPMHPAVVDAVAKTMATQYGNPSSQHGKGLAAREELEQSRAIIAKTLKVQPEELYFTSGGTEANNLAIIGSCQARASLQNSLVTSELEHPSVTKAVRGLKRAGWQTLYLEALNGDLDYDGLTTVLDGDVALISVTSVQNELGYIFDLKRIASIRDADAPDALLHTDAVQAFGKIPLDIPGWGVDLASLSAHKIGGPKGIGALYVKEGTEMFTTAFGGGQERGLRSGTQALPLIVGFAKAAELAMQTLEQRLDEASKLSAHLRSRIGEIFPKAVINSRADGSPFITNFSLPRCNNKQALAYLTERGVYVSVASACESNKEAIAAGTWRKKHPLAMQLAGVSRKALGNTFRISLFDQTSREDIDQFLRLLEEFMVRGSY